MEVGPRIFALRPTDGGIVDLLLSPDAQACSFHTGRILYFAYPMPIDLLEKLTPHELYQFYQHLEGNQTLYSETHRKDWCNIRNRIMIHLSSMGWPRPQTLLLDFMRELHSPGYHQHGEDAFELLDYINRGMQGPVPKHLLRIRARNVEVKFKLPNGRSIVYDPKKDTLRGAIVKANTSGELNKYINAMDWGYLVPVGRSRHDKSDPKLLEWYAWLEDPSSKFGGEFVSLSRDVGARIGAGESSRLEANSSEVRNPSRALFSNSFERHSEIQCSQPPHPQVEQSMDSPSYPADSVPQSDHASTTSAIKFRQSSHSRTALEISWIKKLHSSRKASTSSHFPHQFTPPGKGKEAVKPHASLQNDKNPPPTDFTKNLINYPFRGKAYHEIRKFDPKIHILAAKNVFDFLTERAHKHCRAVHTNFQTENEIEEMVLLYGLPSGSATDILEIPLSLLQFIQAMRKSHTERVLNGELQIHWKGNCWWIVPGSFVPFDQSSASVRRAVVSRRIGRGPYCAHHVTQRKVKEGLNLKLDAVPGSSDSIRASGSNRSANQSQESRVQNAAPSNGLNQPASWNKLSHTQDHDRRAGSAHIEEDPHKTETKEQGVIGQQHKEPPTHEIYLEDIGARIEEVQMRRSRDHSPKIETDLRSQSDTLNGAPRDIIDQSEPADPTSISKTVEGNDLVTEEKPNPVPNNMSRRDSDDQEWLWLNEEHD